MLFQKALPTISLPASRFWTPQLFICLCLGLIAISWGASVYGDVIAAPDSREDSPLPETVRQGDDNAGGPAVPDRGNGRRVADPDADPDGGPAKPFNPMVDGSHVGWLTWRGMLWDGPRPTSIFGTKHIKGTLEGLLKQLDDIARNDKYKGLVIQLDQAGVTLDQLPPIEARIRKIQKRGKKVLFVAEAYGTMTYTLACLGDKVLLQEGGDIELTGLVGEEMYLAGLLEKVGIRADMIQVGRFKGASEQMMRKSPSQYWNENMDKVMDDLYDQILQRIIDRRKLSREEVERLFHDHMKLTQQQWVERKGIDHVVTRGMKDASPMKDRTGVDVAEEQFGDRFEWDEIIGLESPRLQASSPLDLFQMLFQPKRSAIVRPTIAVIHLRGAITSGDSSDGGMFGSASIGSRTIMDALETARDDTHVKAVVLRIDSPGGSALASEMIWQAVRELRDSPDGFSTKPVYVSIGGMAASGGYYIACAGERIYVAPNSIVGSIGVVGGKMTMGELYKKLGVNVKVRGRGPMAGLHNSVAPFTLQQREMIKKSMQRVYAQFTDRIAKGRGNKIKDMDAVAHGRLFTGRQAVVNGLVDAEGSLDQVLAALAKHKDVELEPGQYDVVDLPEPPSFAERVGQFINLQARVESGQSASINFSPGQSALLSTARQLLGEPLWQRVSMTLDGLTLLRSERVLTLLPVVINIR